MDNKNEKDLELELIKKEFSFDPNLFKILKAQLIIEGLIEELLRLRLARGWVLTRKRLTFSRKLDIVDACGLLSTELVNATRVLNNIRNRYVHNLKYKIRDKELNEFTSALGKGFNKSRNSTNKLIKKLPKEQALNIKLEIAMYYFIGRYQGNVAVHRALHSSGSRRLAKSS